MITTAVCYDTFTAHLKPATRALLATCELLIEDNHIYIGCSSPIVSYRLLRRSLSIANIADRLGIGVTLCDYHRRKIPIA